MGTTYSVGGPFSTYSTIADIDSGAFAAGGNTLEIYPGTHTWPSTAKEMKNMTIVGIGGKNACIISGSIYLSSASSGENYISGLTINGTAAVPAIDVQTPTTRCGMHVSDCVLTTSSLAIQNHTPISVVSGTDGPATTIRNIWSSCTAGLACNSNVTAVSSTMAGAWNNPPVDNQSGQAAGLIGVADLLYAAANSGNMTETVTARTIVS